MTNSNSNKDTDITYLSSEYIIVDKNGILNEISHQANNLYNYCLYLERASMHNHQGFIPYYDLYKIIKSKSDENENVLYRKMGYAQTAQQTIKEVCNTMTSFFKELHDYQEHPGKYPQGCPRMPKYLKKGHRHFFRVTNQCVRVKNGYLRIPKFDLQIKLDEKIKINQIKEILFSPLSKNRFKMLVCYEVPTVKLKDDNGIYVAIDPGLDNAFTCVTNNPTKHPLLINGRGAKSVNQFYNKRRAQLAKIHAQNHQCVRQINTKTGIKEVYSESNQMLKLTEWRNNKVKQFAHKASKRIIDYTLSCNANTIIIGHNKNQKNQTKLSKKVNQNFIGIPHNMIIKMIKYKANLVGITVIETEESYTSQTSFLDNELPIKTNGNKARKENGITPINRRIHRGLFKSDNGTLINADVNGAFQIIRKVHPEVIPNSKLVKIIQQPIKYNVKF